MAKFSPRGKVAREIGKMSQGNNLAVFATMLAVAGGIAVYFALNTVSP